MKKYFRYLTLCALLSLLTFGSSASSNSSAARPQRPLDPVCVSACQQIFSECFANAPTPADQHQCLAAYRHCIAHCK